ncbi:MAG: SRPBCC domain-containing protein [Bacteroidetes bacterium]|nr:MAG: SRPBCC domain-containing protein [Bacteroidota bacterium]
MADIYHDFQINATPEKVFEGIASPEGVSAWWSLSTVGKPNEGEVYDLDFGPGYQWKAKVTYSVRPSEFEWEMIEADDDWRGTRIGFRLEADGEKTSVRFHHKGWPHENDHYRISCYCWAMYLRILKRHVEHGEFVPYEDRLNV